MGEEMGREMTLEEAVKVLERAAEDGTGDDAANTPPWVYAIDTVLAALPVRQPIETAPKDGTRILAWCESEWLSVYWDEQFELDWDDEKEESIGIGAWTDNAVKSFGMEEFRSYEPTCWQPLPAPPQTKENKLMESFEDKLRELINRFSMENASNTPDFVLANFMASCLYAYDAAVIERERLAGRDMSLNTVVEP